MNYGHGYKPNRSKYGAKKVYYNGERFDSKKELNRYKELLLIQKAGRIFGLERQVKFELTPTVRGPERIGPRGGRKPGKVILDAASYVADFTYYRSDTGEFVVEDCKGFKTPDYILKKKFLYFLRGILIYET